MKNKLKLFLASILVVATSSSLVGAKNVDPETLALYDTDGDGKLNRAERMVMKKAKAEQTSDVEGFDAEDEMSDDSQFPPKQAKRSKKHKAKMFKEIDMNGDGVISKEEWMAHTPPKKK